METRANSAAPSTGQSLRLCFGQFELDEADARLTRGGQPIALEDDPKQPRCIETASRRGYRLQPPRSSAARMRCSGCARHGR
jgi:hypothetical protein